MTENTSMDSADPDVLREALAAEIVQAVAELPDRTSPEDRPDMMLVTADELFDILCDRLPLLSHISGADHG